MDSLDYITNKYVLLDILVWVSLVVVFIYLVRLASEKSALYIKRKKEEEVLSKVPKVVHDEHTTSGTGTRLTATDGLFLNQRTAKGVHLCSMKSSDVVHRNLVMDKDIFPAESLCVIGGEWKTNACLPYNITYSFGTKRVTSSGEKGKPFVQNPITGERVCATKAFVHHPTGNIYYSSIREARELSNGLKPQLSS